MTGIAAGLKLTPLAFILLLFLIRRRRAGLVAVGGSFLGTVVVGFLLAPSASLGYWTRLAGGDSGGANPA